MQAKAYVKESKNKRKYLISLHHKMGEREKWHIKWEYLG